MQKSEQDYFKDRSVFYSTFPIQEQAKSGNWNYELKAIYFVGILDFVFDENKDDREFFHHEVKLVDTKTQKVFYDKLTYIYLEMPKFKKTEAELKTLFDKWLYVLKSLPKIDDWFTNRRIGLLFEAKIGKGRIMVCGANLSRDLDSRPAARQFRRSIEQYMVSDKFNPETEIELRFLR